MNDIKAREKLIVMWATRYTLERSNTGIQNSMTNSQSYPRITAKLLQQHCQDQCLFSILTFIPSMPCGREQ